MPAGISWVMKVGKRRSAEGTGPRVQGPGLSDGFVEDPKAGADEEEEGELEEDDDAGTEESELGFAEVAGGEEALDHELVGAVGGHG